MQSELKKSLREIAKYHGLYEVLRDEKFVGTSQKSSGKSRPEAGRDDGKGDWDGTESSGENTYSTKKKNVTDSATTKDSSASTLQVAVM